MSFAFKHPDPDKVWRLLKRWKSGHEWSSSELAEFCSLAVEWARYYLIMGNNEEARKILKKRASILKQVETNECITKKTISGNVRYASKRRGSQLETCL